MNDVSKEVEAVAMVARPFDEAPKDESHVHVAAIVRWKKYKPGAPKNLLAIGGRWQEMNEFGGWTNIDWQPEYYLVPTPVSALKHDSEEVSRLRRIIANIRDQAAHGSPYDQGQALEIIHGLAVRALEDLLDDPQ